LVNSAFTNGIDVYVKVGDSIEKFSIIGAFPDRGERALTLARSSTL
jgi:hypothetical protein